jgi:alanyl-tRNA synthetase
MTHQEIRAKFLAYFESKGHTIVPSSSLLPENDSTTLFTGSGMQPILPYLLGEKHPSGTRIVDSQKCFRAEDIDEVGDNRHTTFFEMLGNWSFGDYWKEEQLSWIFNFLINVIKIDPNKLYVTVFLGDPENHIDRDDESVSIWKSLFRKVGIDAKDVPIGSISNGYETGMHNGRIFYYDAKKNWWSRSGIPEHMPAGEPGGPDSEMFYDFGTPHDPKYGKHCHPNCDCGRFLEIGNSVFMEYRKEIDGTFSKLSQRNIDFGGGLERITAVENKNTDIFDIDVFKKPRSILEKETGKTYLGNEKSFRIVLDHIRAAVFLISAGAHPSNKDAGYTVRRLLRRAIRYGDSLGAVQSANSSKSSISSAAESFIRYYMIAYPDLAKQALNILNEIEKEEKKFRLSLDTGKKELRKMAWGIFEKSLNGETIESAGLEINGKNLFLIHSSYGFPFELSIEEINTLRSLRGIGLKPLDSAEIVRLKKEFDLEFKKHQEISRAGAEKKFGGHGMKEGDLTAGNPEELKKKTRLHTATHIIVAALEKVLGQKLPQAGADINIERLRFDFKFPRKVTPEELQQAEKIANDAVDKDLPVSWEEMSVDEAFGSGASGAFKHKYGDRVKVYTIGDSKSPFSREICGGPHITHTGEVGHIHITKEESASGGNRRIRAVID